MNNIYKEILVAYICLVAFMIIMIALSWITAQFDILIIFTMALAIATIVFINIDIYFNEEPVNDEN